MTPRQRAFVTRAFYVWLTPVDYIFAECEKYKFDDPTGIYFTTSTIVHWIDLFTRKEFKHIVVESLKFCQDEKGLKIYAWCLMPSHLHLIVATDGDPLSDIFRDFKKFTNKRIVQELDEINESREWLIPPWFVSSRNKPSAKCLWGHKPWQEIRPDRVGGSLFEAWIFTL